MVKSLGVGGPLEYTVSFLGQVIIIVISRPRSLTICANICEYDYFNVRQYVSACLLTSLIPLICGMRHTSPDSGR